MGYDLHITRRRNWSEVGNDISAEEWLALVARSSDLTIAAEHGLGRIRVRYPSGLILTSLLRAHGLSPAASGTKDSRRPAGG